MPAPKGKSNVKKKGRPPAAASLEPHRPPGTPKPAKNQAQRKGAPILNMMKSGGGGVRSSMPGLMTPTASRVIRA